MTENEPYVELLRRYTNNGTIEGQRFKEWLFTEQVKHRADLLKFTKIDHPFCRVKVIDLSRPKTIGLFYLPPDVFKDLTRTRLEEVDRTITKWHGMFN